MNVSKQGPIKASVQKRDFLPEKTFMDVLIENEAETPLNPQEKSELASLYLDTYVKNDPVFLQDFSQTEKLDYLTQFNKKYQVGQVDYSKGVLGDINKGLTTFNLNVGSVIDPAIDAFTLGMTNNREDAEAQALKEFPGIETDPGALGDAYRFHQNHYANLGGNVLGAFAGGKGLVDAFSKKFAPKIANTLGAGTFSAGTNLNNLLQGKMNLAEAGTNTLFDTLTAPLDGGSKIANAAIQGGTGYLGGLGSSVISDLSRGQQIDWERALTQAAESGALGAGMGAAFAGKPKQPKEKPRIFENSQTQQGQFQGKGRTFYSAVPEAPASPQKSVVPINLSSKQQPKAKISGPKRFTAAQELQAETRSIYASQKKAIDAIDSETSVNEKTTLQARARLAKKQYELSTKIQQGRAATDTPKQQEARAKASQAFLDKYNQIQRELDTKYPTTKAKAPEQKLSPKTKERLVQVGVEYRQGKRSRLGAEAKERDLDFKRLLQKKGVSKPEREEIQAKVTDAINKQKQKAAAEQARKKQVTTEKVKTLRETKAQEAKLERELRANEAKKQREEEKAKAKKPKEEASPKVKKGELIQKESARKVIEGSLQKETSKTAYNKRQQELDNVFGAVKEEKSPKSAKAEKPAPDLPKVLDDAQIETKSDEMFRALQENRKGTLEAELSQLRQQAKKDYTKDGATKERSQALNSTAKRLLDRFFQKKAEADAVKKQKTDPVAITKAKKENLKALEELSQKGGEYIEGKPTGKQAKPSGELYNFEDVEDFLNSTHGETNPEVIEWVKAWDNAARQDAEVVIRYEAERSGDTGEFEFKQVAPRGLGLIQGEDGKYRVIGYATNKNRHDAQYYLEPSPPSKKTGLPSQVIEPPILLKDTKGKAVRGLEPNVHFGAREFNVKDILTRPARINQGATSETRKQIAQAKKTLEKASTVSPKNRVDVKDVKEAVKTVKTAAKKMSEGKKVDVKKEVVEPAKKMTDKQLEESLKEPVKAEPQEISYERWLKENGKRDDSFMNAVVNSRQARTPGKAGIKKQAAKSQKLIEEGAANRAEYDKLVAKGEIIDPNAVGVNTKPLKEIDAKKMPLPEYKSKILEGKNPDKESTKALGRLAEKRWAKANPDAQMKDMEMISTPKAEQSQRVKDAYYDALASAKNRTGKAGLTKDQRTYIQAVLEEKVPAKIFRDYAKAPFSGQEMSVIKNAFDPKNLEYWTSLDGLKTKNSEVDTTVRAAANKLIEKGLLQKSKRGGLNRYSLTEKGRKIAQEGLKFSSDSSTIKIEVPGTKTVYEIPATLDAVLKFADKTGIKLHQTPSQKVHQDLTGDPC
jgi:hypothetical protein